LLKQALAIRERALGADHPKVALSLDFIGRCLFEQGKYQEAKQKFLEAYQISKNVIGENHPITVTYRKKCKIN